MNVKEIEVVYGRKTPAGQFASETISLSVRADVAGDFDRAVSEAFDKARELVARQMRISEGTGYNAPAPSRHDEQGAGDNVKASADNDSSVVCMDEPKEGDTINGWPVIFSYTTKQAVEDGILVYVGEAGRNKVYITSNLFERGGYEDEQKRREFVNRGLELLRKPDGEDTEYMRLRVIDGDKWVIAEPGKITYMLPEDY